MNHHLNVFRYFNESYTTEFIENNLSRAFAICLKHDALFFSQYIHSIISKVDYEYLFSYFESETRYTVDLQINTNDIELTGIKKVYAIAMTGDHLLDMKDFLSLKPNKKETNLTDVWILIKDIAFIIEVKKNNEDCRQQLYDQIYPFITSQIDVIPINFSWLSTVKIMEQVSNIQKLKNSPAYFVEDFLKLGEKRYPHWFPNKPLSLLPPLKNHTPKTIYDRNSRLKQIINHSDFEILGYSDRMAISIPTNWASEVIPYFTTIGDIDYVIFTIWPGNTKGQGWHLYNKPLDWSNKNSVIIQDEEFEIDTEYHMKFCHFNKYITSINFTKNDVKSPVNTFNNFKEKSGKWDIEDWGEFEAFMDKHFNKDFNWKAKTNWEKHFINTDRSYFTVAFGFETDLYIPYKKLQQLDKSIDDYFSASVFINDMMNSLKKLID